MKITQPLFLSFAILALLLFSCKKDSGSNNNTNPPAVTDSNYLFRAFIVDSTASAEDTIEILSYYYDNAGRVTNVADSFIHSGVRTAFSSTDYSYNGTDTVPYKHYRTYADAGVYDTTTKFF